MVAVMRLASSDRNCQDLAIAVGEEGLVAGGIEDLAHRVSRSVGQQGHLAPRVPLPAGHFEGGVGRGGEAAIGVMPGEGGAAERVSETECPAGQVVGDQRRFAQRVGQAREPVPDIVAVAQNGRAGRAGGRVVVRSWRVGLQV